MAGVKVTGEVVQGAGVQIADDGTLSATVSSPSFDALFGSTPGAFIYRGSASWAALSPGVAGQLLQSGGANGTPSWLSPSSVLDNAFGNTQGDILYRGVSSWSAVAPSAMLDSAFSNAQGAILYRGASGWTALSPGTSGYALTSGGANANPTWTLVAVGLPVRADAAQSLTATQQDQAQQNLGLSTVMRSYIAGLTLSTVGGSTTFTIAAGIATDSTNVDLMALASALSKTTAAWVAGSGNGALDTGTIAANTWYHVHQIKNPTTGAIDALVSLSATAPTLPSGYTLFRRVGSLKTNGSSQWTSFTQFGGWVYWGTSIAEVNGVAVTSGSDVTVTLAGAPPGVRVRPLLRVGVACNTNDNAGIAVRSPDMMGSETNPGPEGGNADAGITEGGGTVVRVGAPTLPVLTNTSAQIVYNAYLGSGGTGVANIRNYGYFDLRGANS